MPIPVPQSIAIIAVVAVCTYLTRAAAFLLFGGKKQVPDAVRYLGRVLPPAIIAILVVYCLKGIEPLAYPHGAPELIAVAAVAVLHVWKRNNLLSIGLGTVFYMFLVQVVFA